MKNKFIHILFFIVLLLPMSVYAKTEHGIERFYIDAVVLEDGDLLVQEYFEVNGDYNGYIRNIDYRSDSYPFDPSLEWYGPSNINNGSGIKLLDVRSVKVDDFFNFENVKGDEFVLDDDASNGDYGVYNETKTENGISVKIYNPDYKKRAFYIKYRLDNMGIKFNDVSSIFWNLPINELEDSIGHLQVNVRLKTASNDFRVWAHGPMDGYVKKVDNTILYAYVTDVLVSENDIDVRMTFDREYLSSSNKIYNVNALDKILAFENDKANQANYERTQKNKKVIYKINELYAECNNTPSIDLYLEMERLVKGLESSDEKTQLLGDLEKIRVKVMLAHKRLVYTKVNEAKKYKTYDFYDEAYEATLLLDDSVFKTEMLDELKIVKDDIYANESVFHTLSTLINGCLVSVLGILGYFLYKYKKNRKEKVFNHKYNRELLEISPTDISYILHGRKITTDSFSSEILQLIVKKYITVEKVGKNDYKFTKVVLDSQLTEKELCVMNLLFKKKVEIKLSKIKNQVRYKDWEKFEKVSIKEAVSKDFYVMKENKYIIPIIPIVAMLVATATAPVGGYFILYLILFGQMIYEFVKADDKFKILKRLLNFITFNVFLFLLGMLFVLISFSNIVYYGIIVTVVTLVLLAIVYGYLYITCLDPLTLYGLEQKAKIQGFKNFVKDFSTMDEKELPHVKLWGSYLAFAVVLGCASKLETAMKMKYEELNINDDFMDMAFNIHLSNMISSQLTSSVYNSVNYTSGGSYSSGAGSGGGFSSGGGFGGGGGGGGRF